MTHPITPPPELVEWLQDLGNLDAIALAYQAGADQELEAYCEWLCTGYADIASRLRAARRPRPPSLKEQSLALIDLIQGNEKAWDTRDLDVVRRALEQLND
jgi:hypothetical protein